MKIFLDDQCDTERKEWMGPDYIGVRNFAEFKNVVEGALASGEKIEEISFDNDLGEDQVEGWEIAKWLTEVHPEIFLDNPELHAHSANPAGKKNIEYYIDRGRKYFRDLIEAKERTHPWGEKESKNFLK